MKRVLAGRLAVAVTAAAGAFLLAACSGGSATPGPVTGGGAVAAGASVPVPTTSAPVTTSSAPTTSSATSAPATTSAPKTTSSAPKTTTRPATANVPCAKAAASSGTAACVDISAHRAWLLRDGEVIYGPVSMLPGRKGHATPTGTFHVLSKEKMHYSREFDNAPMPNSVFFYPGDAFHTGSLKTYSHGCVHLSSKSSLKFFTTLHLGDVVQVVP